MILKDFLSSHIRVTNSDWKNPTWNHPICLEFSKQATPRGLP